MFAFSSWIAIIFTRLDVSGCFNTCLARARSVVVNTSACHAEDRRFESGRARQRWVFFNDTNLTDINVDDTEDYGRGRELNINVALFSNGEGLGWGPILFDVSYLIW